MKCSLKKYAAYVTFLILAVSIVSDFSVAQSLERIPKFLAFSGSSREDSYNKKALNLLIKAIEQEGGQVTYVKLSDYELPLYNGDLEANQGVPENAKKLQDLIASHDGLVIATPEYNGLPTPLLINTLDWVSREVESKQNSGMAIFKGKTAALIAVSPGKSGDSRSITVLKQFLNTLGVQVIAVDTTIPNVMEKLTTEGQLKDEVLIAQLKKEAKSLIQASKNN